MNLFTFFHLNLAFSSIEEAQRPEVICDCYWPLLRLAEENNFPVGIELSGYTLETIQKLDPGWIAAFKKLHTKGLVELIGSGYAQMIGPLAPPEVTVANLRIGNRVYEEILNTRPEIALINEQAYSAGLIQHYIDAGYKAIIMEWNNPARFHPEWDPEWRYLPQMAAGQHDEKIPVIWNKSISFQKFQRYAHGEMSLDEYLAYIGQHLSDKPRTFCLYGNDAEIFDFRPGRFHTEAKMSEESEWARITHLLKTLRSDKRFKPIAVSEVLKELHKPNAGNSLALESPEQPTPVKKQEKYNLTRWAVTGKHNLHINTECSRLTDALKEHKNATDEHRKELCYLWSSDFRTHITTKRLDGYFERLKRFQNQILPNKSSGDLINQAKNSTTKQPAQRFFSQFEGRFLVIDSDLLRLELNCKKGLAINSLVLKSVSEKPLIGTLPHGYFDDISMGADFFSGHLVFETPGKPKITDLEAVSPSVNQFAEDVEVCATIDTPAGKIKKSIVAGVDGVGAYIKVGYVLDWEDMPIGSLRLGATTLNPEAFDSNSLYYATHNGGNDLETFAMANKQINHGTAPSFLVSASGGLGMTSGLLILGDKDKQFRIQLDPKAPRAIGLITHRPVSPSYFCRHQFSLLEMDDTSNRGGLPGDYYRGLGFGYEVRGERG